MTILHVKSTDADTITKAITSYLQEKNLNRRKLVGQGYDGAETFSGCRSGVQQKIRTHVAHALYIHCSCQQLQLAYIQVVKSVLSV